MKVSVFGGTGFIGTPLVKALQAKGHEVSVLDVRRSPNWAQQVANADAVINLAGFPLFKKRWSTEVKTEIHESRVESTKSVVKAIAEAKAKGQGPKVFVNGSAIGFYGPDNDVEFTEHSQGGADFLAFVCRDWEEEARKAQNLTRTVIIRTGVVLGKNGGALQQLLPPFKLGLGGPVGSGKQWMSWIHLDDMVGILIHAIETENVKGALNATAPTPVRNKEFGKQLGHALGRPAFMPLPGLALYALVGEAAEILVNGQKVMPVETLKSGYTFKYTQIEAAFKNLLT